MKVRCDEEVHFARKKLEEKWSFQCFQDLELGGQ